ncbi:sigma 54-interacting transcriptional regulator [Azospirillum sp.]|uniref:sigma 54-interacting transcriptional regulator n=1 Tax=Azospirillum sp. TaxID=34012 RepID=UPI002D421BE0|nr:sigma 54-interacting transcriptional regulator [Azospirillum sp.]HYD71123.1 sigma 54-interacting transcriptional regulator [Azospirillum sp.]HYH23197.1 sigma 54-interacting transcriptional regulator [Azospirillum sp.]
MERAARTALDARRGEIYPLTGVLREVRQPEIGDLAERLYFNPSDGRIWLDDRRMILLHSDAFGTLRRQLIDMIGVEATRGVLTRIGYIAGCNDAAIAWKIRGGGSMVDLLAAGGQFHALQGIVRVEPLRLDVDSTKGQCYAEFVWKHSVEDEFDTAEYGPNHGPSCWMEIGYSSGYLSTIMGKRILVRELECRSMGSARCLAVAKPVDEWDDPEADLKYIEGRTVVRPSLPVAVSSGGPGLGGPVARCAPRPAGAADGGMVGVSSAFASVMHKVRRVARTNATVLLLGESGVGKSMFAREVHRHSRRADAVFVEINCAAIPEQLMESELFGVEKGAFSGASDSRAGRFEIADGGTLFLDEVATLSLTAQGKLLRVLQTGEMERLGSTRTKKVDVRIVAATNENLLKAVREGRFREDLFYRLNVFPITISPLRDRKDDIPALLEHFIDKFSRAHGCSVSGVTPKALQAILSHSWPGNIREFENVIERGVILAEDGEALDVRHLSSVDASFEASGLLYLSDMGSLVEGVDLLDSNYDGGDPQVSEDDIAEWARMILKNGAGSLNTVEEALVRAAVQLSDGNMGKAASMLGVSRAQMYYRAKKLPR